MSVSEKEDDLMRTEDWKAMYMMLFHTQTEVLEKTSILSAAEVADILRKAMQNAEEYYIGREDPETL